MQLSRIVLSHFRNRSRDVFDLEPHLTVITGENARGKTNILESIYFLINGIGFRESKEEELIQIGQIDASVEGRFQTKDQSSDYKILLGKADGKVTKHFFVERTKKSHRYYLKEQTRAVLFTPEQIEIISGSPDIRRSYMNKLFSFYDPDYRLKLINLESALRRRNKILEQFVDEKKT
jgi:DNA replication and repair protein RecF